MTALIDARSLPELVRWRRQVQARRRAPDSALMELMTSRFDTALISSPAARRAEPLLDLYRRLVCVALRRAGS